MIIQNAQNKPVYTPQFQAKLSNNYHLKELLIDALEKSKYKEYLSQEISKLNDIYPNTELEFSKRMTTRDRYIPVIKNLTNGNIVSGFENMKKRL